jgi:hypothetical protein
MLAELIERVGETDPHDNYDFDIEDAEYFADFFNNGGLEFHNNGYNYALIYAALYEGGRVQIGAWSWADDEDFDEDATFEVYDEDDFSGEELKMIYDKIVEIYGTV